MCDSPFDFVGPDSDHCDFNQKQRELNCNEVLSCGFVLSEKNVDNKQEFVDDDKVHFLCENVNKSQKESYQENNCNCLKKVVRN